MIKKGNGWSAATYVLALVGCGLFLPGCGALQQLASFKKPKVDLEDMRLVGLDFDGMDLVFDLKVNNPNSLGISLGGFDYDLAVGGASLVQGINEEALQIEADGQTKVPVPLRLEYGDLYRAVKTLAANDEAPYELKCGLNFDLPVLGATRIPVSRQGTVPLVKRPGVGVGGLRVKKLNLLGADIELELELDNPNFFAIGLEQLNYNLAINGGQWAAGKVSETLAVGAKEKKGMTIPLSLNFVQMGRAAFQLLKGDRLLDYRLSGDVDLKTDHPLLERVKLPLDLLGKLKVDK